MKKRVASLLCLASISLWCASAQAGEWDFNKWDDTTQKWEVTYQLLNVVDVMQTEYALHNGGQENNPLVGKHPSDSKMIGFGIAWGLTHYLATGFFFDKAPWMSKAFRYISMTEKAGCVVWNVKVIAFDL